MKNLPDIRGVLQPVLDAPLYSMWYDVTKTLSYNKLLNFVVGPRGVGKTYSAKRYVINRWLKKGEQFVYLRRFETEIKKGQVDKFFADIGEEFPDNEFKTKNGVFFIDSKECGYYLCLSKAAQYKSVPFPKVQTIIFDEFIIDQGLIRYLPGEVTTFNEMYSTIARLRDVKVLFLSNAITFTNPYFLYFDVSLKKGQTLYKGDDILVELVKNEEYSNTAKNTRFGKIIAGTEYSSYAMDNEFLRDTDTFIEKIPTAAVAVFSIRTSGKTFGVYATGAQNLMKWYISDSYDQTVKVTISLDMEDHDSSTYLRNNPDAIYWLETLRQKFAAGEVRFTSMTAKNIVAGKLK